MCSWKLHHSSAIHFVTTSFCDLSQSPVLITTLLLPTPNLSSRLHPCPLLCEAHSPWSNLSNWMLFIINITLLIRTITLDQTFLLTPNPYYKLDNSNSLKTVIRQLKICTIYLYLHIHPSNGATLTGVAFQIFFLYYSICIFFSKRCKKMYHKTHHDPYIQKIMTFYKVSLLKIASSVPSCIHPTSQIQVLTNAHTSCVLP